MNFTHNKLCIRTPVCSVFGIIIAIIFIGELLIMFCLPFITPTGSSKWLLNLIDATTLSLLAAITVAPFLMRFRQLARDTDLALEIASEGYWKVTEDGRIIDVNQGYCQMIGYSREQILNMHIADFEAKESHIDIKSHIDYVITNGRDRFETVHRHQSGHHINVEVSVSFVAESRHFICFLRDFTERKAAADEIENLAFYDPLTHLPNRKLLLDRLNQALVISTRSGGDGALLFLDLDHFKTLNDTLGHDVGDVLLQQVAARLTSCVREGDTVARLGGDEFVIMLENLSEYALEAAAQSEAIGEKVISVLNQPYQLYAKEHHSTASIGIALFSDKEHTQEDLLKHADIAMYQAKKAGRNTLRFFDTNMQDAINIRVDIEHELRKALIAQQFQLYYQIQVDNLGQPMGAEALIRWLHPERGLVSPLHFIPLAEETGLILPIGQWVLETACEQLKKWEHDTPTSSLVMAVNVSAKQFRQVDFVAQVQATILRHGINPKLLKLELTESMLLENIEDVITKMNELKEIGIRFSLDDFGTGFSSLQYLKKLPLDQLKVDQSFVHDIATDKSDRSIVRTIIAMAYGLDLNVIAEGVETEEQRQLLFNRGCSSYQGYLFGKPLPIEEFDRLITELVYDEH